MLQQIMQSYLAYMATGEKGAMIHMVGPAGSGKSQHVEQLAELVGVKLHKISVPRLVPMEIEGVQYPISEGDQHKLALLLAVHWTRMSEGDICFYDEFLAGFPEVYNALLDIFTSREVGGYKLPRVFMIAASNSAVAPTPAMGDRLLHLAVRDARKSKAERNTIAGLLVSNCGFYPQVMDTPEMTDLIEQVILPTYDVLDHILDKKSKTVGTKSREGRSLRNLISQVNLRFVQTTELKALIDANNSMAMRDGKPQFVIMLGKAPTGYEKQARGLVGNPRLTQIQASNLDLNLQMIELAAARIEKEEE